MDKFDQAAVILPVSFYLMFGVTAFIFGQRSNAGDDDIDLLQRQKSGWGSNGREGDQGPSECITGTTRTSNHPESICARPVHVD